MEPPTDDVSQAHGLCGLDDEGLCGSDEERLALAQELIRQQYLGMCRETSAAGVKGAHFSGLPGHRPKKATAITPF